MRDEKPGNNHKTEDQLIKELLALQRRLAELKAAESGRKEALRESENRYRNIFETMPVSIWEEDFSGILKAMDDLRKKGIANLTRYISDHPGFVRKMAKTIKVLDTNEATAKMFGAKDKDELLKSIDKTFVPESYDVFKKELIAIAEGKASFESECILQTLQGGRRYVFLRMKIPEEKEGYNKLIVTIVDITEREKAQQRLKELYAELLKINKKLKQAALRDSHTGLYNHRYLEDAIETELYRAKRYAHPLSVMMLDIDYFKSINDAYGHRFGDLVLKQFSRLIKEIVRRYDIVIRFGGEEFIVISPGVTASPALVMAQRILDAINLHKFGNKKHVVKLKVSIAVSSYPESNVSRGMDLIDLADRILNRVKEYGGNRVYTAKDIKRAAAPVLEKDTEDDEIKMLKTKIERLNKRANQSIIEAIFAFAKTIEVKDHYTAEHGERTVHFATEIAKVLSLPSEEIERIKQAAILHDLGKVGISEKILLKKAKLTKKEMEIIREHPQIGIDIIRPIHFLHSIIPLIFYHHERWDGKGYPTGLKGNEIPMGARIIALADAFQALTSDRSYRKAYSLADALKIIKRGSGSQFDPAIIKAFMKIIKADQK